MKRIFIVLALLCAGVAVSAQGVSIDWKTVPMNGSRTGVKAANAQNTDEAMGTIRGCSYVAPNGRKFHGSTKKAAKIMLAAQPQMAQVKEVIAYSSREMTEDYPECELYDWFIDELMRAVEDSTGRKVDIGITNRGGVRVDMPKGDVLLDDIMSMFPFRNSLYYLALRGRDIRAVLDHMAATRFEILGGMKVVAKDGKIVSVMVGDEPLDDDKLYGVATISFLLDGGDGYFLQKNAEKKIRCKGYIIDTMLAYVRSLTAQGKPVEYKTDGRITILDREVKR